MAQMCKPVTVQCDGRYAVQPWQPPVTIDLVSKKFYYKAPSLHIHTCISN